MTNNQETVCYDCLWWDEQHGKSEYITFLHDLINQGEFKLIPQQPSGQLCCDYWLQYDYVWIDTEVI